MIQLIGFMIGFYIFTRMIELASNKNIGGIVKAFSAITMIVVLICMFGLLGAGSQVTSALGQ